MFSEEFVRLISPIKSQKAKRKVKFDRNKRESAASAVPDQWPQVRSVAVSASLDDIPDLPEHTSIRDLRSPLLEDEETLLSPMTTLCYDPPFDRTFREGFREETYDEEYTNKRFNSTPHVAPIPDYTTLMRLCGEGDANALDSFLSVNPESLQRNGNAYLGVMADMKHNSMRVTSAESIRVPEPQVIISPIVSAILGGNPECVRLLVEAGASVNSPNGITDNMCARADCPLSSALRVDRMDVAEYLVSQGANLGESLMRLGGCTDRRLARMLGVRLGVSVNVVECRDPDIQALWRLISQQILILTPTPLETAFLLGRAFRLLACVRPALTSHWERLGTACERFSVQLIDQCLSTEEVTAVMSRDHAPSRQSAPIHDALYYGRNEFVSHPATYRMLQQRITRSKSGKPQPVDILLCLVSPVLLPFISVISYLLCGIRRDSILRKYMYRVYSPFAVFTSSLITDLLLLVLVVVCSICSSHKMEISWLEIATWTLGLGVLVSEIERRRLLVWYYQFRFVCDLLILTWLISILLIKLRMYSSPLMWEAGVDAVQILYGVLLITLSVRLLSILRPLIPCNPLCVINQLLPDFFSYAAVLGFLYLVFSVAIHTVYMSTATTEHRETTIVTVLFLSLQRVVSTPGNTAAGNIAAQLLFISFLALSLLTFISFSISCFGKIQVSKRSCDTEKRCSVMKLVMMHEANHPVPAPFNLITWPLTMLGARVLCSPCKKGVREVVWGDEQYNSLHNTSLHDKQDVIARVCARLTPPQRNDVEIDSYEAIMTMREDLYKLYSKLDSEGIKLDALQAVWQSFVSLQDNLASLQNQVTSLLTDGERNNTLLQEQNDRVIGITKLLETKSEEDGQSPASGSAAETASSTGRFSDI
ncbi:uncharacterized protein LOC134822291 isoform X2 [Bolinopsis microptera]|uniref:uncharacterized protein LOC134822291 isoform X2 n=1 Tax=Bolinopsis microptera TaxID=2820187 RepID=UPI00307955E6